MKKIAFIILVSHFIISDCCSQQMQNDSISKFKNFSPSHIVLTGNSYTTFGVNKLNKNIDSSGMYTSFVEMGFMPICIWKLHKNIFIESELETVLSHGKLGAEISYLNVSFIINDLGTLQIGRFLSPYGIYAERFHPAWINSTPNDPLGFSHGNYSPASDFGIALRGGSSHINYTFYAVSNPIMNDGSQNQNDAGKIDYDTGFELSEKISLGGRIGILPFKSSEMELGLSSRWLNIERGLNHHIDAGHDYEDVEEEKVFIQGNTSAIDLSMHKNIYPIKGRIDLKAQYNYTFTGINGFVKNEQDSIHVHETEYSFKNKTEIAYVLLTYKPIFAKNKIIKNAGIYARASTLRLPKGSLWYENTSEFTVGLNYSFSWRNQIKIGVQKINSNSNKYSDNIIMQWAFAF